MTEHKKHITIIVEGSEHEWHRETISYDEVVTLEVPSFPQHREVTYAVKFSRGHGSKPEGVLALGQSIKVKNGMRFSVSETRQS